MRESNLVDFQMKRFKARCRRCGKSAKRLGRSLQVVLRLIMKEDGWVIVSEQEVYCSHECEIRTKLEGET